MAAAWTDADTWCGWVEGIQADDVEALFQPDVLLGDMPGIAYRHVVVTASLQAWSAGSPNLGWAFLPVSENGWNFRSSEASAPAQRPRLEVVFEWNDCNYDGVDDSLQLISDACPFRLGDVNNDGEIDGHDVMHFILVYLGLDQCECSVLAADIDGDGDVDRADMRAFMRLLRCNLGMGGGLGHGAAGLIELADELGAELDLRVWLEDLDQPTRGGKPGMQEMLPR